MEDGQDTGSDFGDGEHGEDDGVGGVNEECGYDEGFLDSGARSAWEGYGLQGGLMVGLLRTVSLHRC